MGQRPWEIAGDNQWLRYWRLAEPHRRRQTDLILASAAQGGSVCVWGAGSCHDLDLPRLQEAGLSLTLVDLARDNVCWGVEYQLGTAAAGVEVLAPLDLAGVAGSGPDPAELLKRASEHTPSGLGHYDTVVSAGMLSQIIIATAEAAGADTQRTSDAPDVVRPLVAARRRHLRLMTDHLNPGGAGLVVIDVLNSDDVPELAEATETEVADIIAREASAADRSHVLAQELLLQDLLHHTSLASRVREVNRSGYWAWQMTQRTYACYALQFRV